MMGSLYSARALVNAGADVNLRNKEGGSPLREAKIYGHEDVLEYLAKKTNDTAWDRPFPGEKYQRWAQFYMNSTERQKREHSLRLHNPTSDDFWVAMLEALEKGEPPSPDISEEHDRQLWFPNVSDTPRRPSRPRRVHFGSEALDMDIGVEDEAERLQIVQGMQSLTMPRSGGG